jgi:hypothetical protein
MTNVINLQEYRKKKQNIPNEKGIFSIIGLEKESAKSLIFDIYEHLTSNDAEITDSIDEKIKLTEEDMPNILMICAIEKDDDVANSIEDILEQVLANIKMGNK